MTSKDEKKTNKYVLRTKEQECFGITITFSPSSHTGTYNDEIIKRISKNLYALSRVRCNDEITL